jgi:SAM-dependent methyltransferase
METPDTPWAKDQDIRINKPKIDKPNPAAVFFSEFLTSKSIRSGRLIEVGGGNGRNAVFFAEKGFEVHCVDKDSIPDLDLYGVMPHSHNVGDFWHFEMDYFDAALDVSCYSCLSDTEKQNYRMELKRVVQNGGFYLLGVLGKDSKKIEKEFHDFQILSTKTIENQYLFLMRLP